MIGVITESELYGDCTGFTLSFPLSIQADVVCVMDNVRFLHGIIAMGH